MTQQKKKSEWININSPRSPWKFINLGKVDQEYKHYSVDIVLSPENPKHEAFINEVKALNKKLFDEKIVGITIDADRYRPKRLIKPELRKNEEGAKEPTGNFTLKVKSKDMKPIFDSTGKNRVSKEDLLRMWSGTEGRVAIALKPHIDDGRQTIGYIAYLDKAKVIEPKWATEGGFGDEDEEDEGGWTADDSPSAASGQTDVDSMDSNDPDAGAF